MYKQQCFFAFHYRFGTECEVLTPRSLSAIAFSLCNRNFCFSSKISSSSFGLLVFFPPFCCVSTGVGPVSFTPASHVAVGSTFSFGFPTPFPINTSLAHAMGPSDNGGVVRGSLGGEDGDGDLGDEAEAVDLGGWGTVR